MKLADLPFEMIEKIKPFRYDLLSEKHEGPWNWSSELANGDVEIISLAGYDVLLPITMKQHPNITVIRCITSADQQTLTLFLKDTTFLSNYDEEFLFSGKIAICDRVKESSLFVAIVYHDWYLVEQN